MSDKSIETAFLYADGKFYFGRNHIVLMNEADLADEWGTATKWHKPHNLVMGWIWNNQNDAWNADDDTQSAEFYSDSYQDAQNSGLFETVFHELKKYYPNLTELTFGPDKDTWEEMQKEPDWMEKYISPKEASVLTPEQIIREIVSFANTGQRPNEETLQRMTDDAHKIRYVDPDRVRVELDDLLASERPSQALRLADECGLLDYLIPELGAAYDFNQNNIHHALTIGEHSLSVLDHVSRLNKDPDVRLAALMHDVGKPDSYWEDNVGAGHFYSNPSIPGSESHEDRGADMTREFMQRLSYDPERVNRVENLVRNHMLNPWEMGAKYINRAGGPQAASDLLDLKEGDIRGKGTSDIESQLGKLEMSRALYNKQLQSEEQ